jgi:CPA2 family monovalent cation:H+ antiporter-2
VLVKVAAFVGFMLVVGPPGHPVAAALHRPYRLARTVPAAVLAIALGVAFGAAPICSASAFALGAFFAGMILSESELSHRAAEESLPLRDAFAVLFFVSVGMLFDPSILLRDPLAGARHAGDHHRRQVGRGLPDRRRLPPPRRRR